MAFLFVISFGCPVPAFSANAKPGDIAIGKVISDDGEALVLDTGPCGKTAKTITFTKPYNKHSAGQEKCDDSKTTYEAVEVEQLPPEMPKDQPRPPSSAKKK